MGCGAGGADEVIGEASTAAATEAAAATDCCTPNLLAVAVAGAVAAPVSSSGTRYNGRRRMSGGLSGAGVIFVFVGAALGPVVVSVGV